MESAIDECARAAGADALAFRLRHLDPPRLKAVLQRAADAAQWQHPRLREPAERAGILRGRGLAGGIYKGMSYAAAVANVEVDTTTGAVCVRELWCAHDCGHVVNPDQVRGADRGQPGLVHRHGAAGRTAFRRRPGTGPHFCRGANATHQ